MRFIVLKFFSQYDNCLDVRGCPDITSSKDREVGGQAIMMQMMDMEVGMMPIMTKKMTGKNSPYFVSGLFFTSIRFDS